MSFLLLLTKHQNAYNGGHRVHMVLNAGGILLLTTGNQRRDKDLMTVFIILLLAPYLWISSVE